MNHTYSTPELGTTDWHIPLNENFKQLDTDVEIRGPEGDKGDYEPKQGAKYYATDTGAIYMGNGSSWVLADIAVDGTETNNLMINDSVTWPDGTTTTTSPGDGGGKYAAFVSDAAELQDRIDNLSSGEPVRFSDAVNHVCVAPGTTLKPSAPITIPEGVAVDFNGCLITPTADVDVLQQSRNTEVRNVTIDCTAEIESYSSNAYSVSADHAGGSFDQRHRTIVKNAFVRGPTGSGTGILTESTSAGNMARVDIHNWCVRGFEYSVRISQNSDGWNNATRLINGSVSNYRVGIRVEGNGSAECAANVVRGLHTQPQSGLSDWLFEVVGSRTHRNTVLADVWDYNRYNGQTVFHIGPNGGNINKLIDTHGLVDSSSHMVNEAGSKGTENHIFNFFDAIRDTF